MKNFTNSQITTNANDKLSKHNVSRETERAKKSKLHHRKMVGRNNFVRFLFAGITRSLVQLRI